MDKRIKIAIVGVGNCAKSFLEGLEYYRLGETTGLMNPRIGGYGVSDIECVAAFDVDLRKVGKRLNEAAAAEPNRTLEFAKLAASNVIVQRGHTLDSVIPELREYFIHESSEPPCDVARTLRESGAEILVNYLPTGSDEAAWYYAERALEAGCSMINCMPSPLARDEAWQLRFEGAGLVLMGDDVKSQFGATILNRTLLDMLTRRGVEVAYSRQVNYGGNCDHFNLHYRAEAKEETKQAALSSVHNGRGKGTITARMVYTEKNYDHKKALIEIEGRMFGGVQVGVKMELDDEDSPNSGGCVVDAIRYARTALDTGDRAKLDAANAYLFKSPYRQISDFEAVVSLAPGA
jgi:myo-inositol-1-phosphate synthase